MSYHANQIKIIDKGLAIMIVKLKGTIDGHSENHIDVDVGMLFIEFS